MIPGDNSSAKGRRFLILGMAGVLLCATILVVIFRANMGDQVSEETVGVMIKGTEITARYLVDLSQVVGQRHLIRVAVGANLEPIILTLDQPPDYRIETKHGSFAKKKAERSNNFRIHFQADDKWIYVDLAETPENYHHVQPFGKGEWLLVRGRSANDKDENAHIYGQDGKAIRSFHGGDGIEDVQVTEQGEIWISYFDEGVFGDSCLGKSGLVCLDQRGRVIFRFTSLSDSIVQTMADCYSLNVCSNRETWLYYYTDFPLVKLVDKSIAKHWLVPVKGSHSFAVDGKRVLFGGSYEKRESLFLGVFGDSDFKQLIPLDKNGNPLKNFRAFGRRHQLYLETENTLYVVDLKSL